VCICYPTLNFLRVVSGEMFSETWQIPYSLLRQWNGYLVLLKPVRSMVEVLKPTASDRGRSAQCLVNPTITVFFDI
jgi:hypothetical protein